MALVTFRVLNRNMKKVCRYSGICKGEGQSCLELQYIKLVCWERVDLYQNDVAYKGESEHMSRCGKDRYRVRMVAITIGYLVPQWRLVYYKAQLSRVQTFFKPAMSSWDIHHRGAAPGAPA
jgi:hypothetical protein